MQQSKTPNNIKSVIRQVNFVRAPKDLHKVKGGKLIQKVIVQKGAGSKAPMVPSSNSRLKKRSVDFAALAQDA